MDAKRMYQSAMMMRFVRKLASLRLTLLAMLGLVMAIFIAYFNARVSYVWIAVPLGVMAVNLAAALATNPRLRSEPALVGFHLALVVLCVLGALDALTRFQGRVELVNGQMLHTGQVQVITEGLWHRSQLDGLMLKQGTIKVEYAPGMIRQQTRSAVYYTEGTEEKRVVLSETRPLILQGYRFAPTPNKGYAMVLSWRDANGKVAQGAIHFPSYPAHEWRQQQAWQTPAGQRVSLELKPPERPPTDSPWVLKAEGAPVKAFLMMEGDTVELEPGYWHEMQNGALRLDDVRLWMGYSIDYQPAIQWLFAVSLIGIAALAAYFYRRLWRPSMRARRVVQQRSDSDVVARI
ncbi:MAG: cytochrome c biogenesis protein ResB [Betaproteobacteria bacterium]|nr:MAG: cytochrome c biogenesis protein ResB [Betaproteobacteria bacterium]